MITIKEPDYDDFEFQKKLNLTRVREKDEAIKNLWQWIKEDAITLKQFKVFIKEIENK